MVPFYYYVSQGVVVVYYACGIYGMGVRGLNYMQVSRYASKYI